jgi:hypothetical protein
LCAGQRSFAHNYIVYIPVVSPLHSKHLGFPPFLFLCKALKRNQSEGDKARAIWSPSGSQPSVSGTPRDGLGGWMGWREIRQLTRSLIKDGLATLYAYIGITHTYVYVGYNYLSKRPRYLEKHVTVINKWIDIVYDVLYDMFRGC